jgi:pimeloyl-ACP methyl ester carboxylesterase
MTSVPTRDGTQLYVKDWGKGRPQAVLIGSVVPFMLKTADNPEGVDQATFDKMAAGIRDDRAKFWTAFFDDFYGVGYLTQQVSDEVISWSARLAMQASLKATLDCAAAFASTDFRPDLPSFTMPTLIIHGTHDKTVPIAASARPAAAAITGSILLEYDGAPHGLLASHTQRLIDDVMTFVTGGIPKALPPVDVMPDQPLLYPINPVVS